MSLHNRILLAMLIGLLAGMGMYLWGDAESRWFIGAIWWFDLMGKDIFIGSLKMIIAPLIFASIVAGIASLPNPGELGNIGVKTLVYYFLTTTFAVAIGITAVLIVRPGTKEASQRVREDRVNTIESYRAAFESSTGMDSRSESGAVQFRVYIAEREGESISESALEANWQRIKETETRGPLDMFRDEIVRPILTNPFNALSQGTPNALGIIFFAILVGLACVIVGKRAAPVGAFFESFNGVMMTITLWIMEFAPLGIACIIASLVATLGVDALQSLAWYCATVIGGIVVHVCLLITIAAVVGKMAPRTLIAGARDAWLIAFTTTSSAATLPVTIHCTTKKMNVSEKVARFTLPVGATVNMDGTALYEGVAVIFLIQVYGGLEDVPIVIGGMQTFVIFVTAVFASIGAAAVPSAGLITMAIVAGAVGLPLHYIFFIFAVDRFLDMFRTSTNVLGDMVGAIVVHRLEGKRLGLEPVDETE